MRTKRLVVMLFAATAMLVSSPGAAMAESSDSVSREQMKGAVQRVLEKRHSAADLALVKSVPEIGRYIPDPSGPTITVTGRTSTGAGAAAAGGRELRTVHCRCGADVDVRIHALQVEAPGQLV